MDVFRSPSDRRLYEFVNLDNSRRDIPPGRVVNPGHAIESMWFMLHLFQRENDRERMRQAIETIRWHFDLGWDEEYGGLLLARDAEGSFWENKWDMKIWWPHTEALYALLLAYSISKEQWCLDDFQRVHEYAFSHFPVPEYGEWTQNLDRQGTPVKHARRAAGKRSIPSGTGIDLQRRRAGTTGEELITMEIKADTFLPIELVFNPNWWHQAAGISFDEPFYLDAETRSKNDVIMRRVLHERYGDLGLGEADPQPRPVIGSMHVAGGFVIPALLGAPIRFEADAAPQPEPIHLTADQIDALQPPDWKNLWPMTSLIADMDALETQYGYVIGDLNTDGLLNAAYHFYGQDLFTDFYNAPDRVRRFLGLIGELIARSRRLHSQSHRQLFDRGESPGRPPDADTVPTRELLRADDLAEELSGAATAHRAADGRKTPTVRYSSLRR